MNAKFKSQTYMGYKITHNPKKNIYVARHGRKILTSNTCIDSLKSSIEAWAVNVALSIRIDSTKY